MKAMSDFFFYRAQCFLFKSKLSFQEFLSSPELIEDCCQGSLPREGHPCEKGRAVALISPVFTFKGGGEGRSAFGRGGKDTALRAERWFVVARFGDQAKARQL